MIEYCMNHRSTTMIKDGTPIKIPSIWEFKGREDFFYQVVVGKSIESQSTDLAMEREDNLIYPENNNS